ncbi:MAG: hypothetical protein ICV83_32615, partial [Cytophagales bacterium]|nr:hypothetical protein [Cytophagales bacterium]
WKSDGTDAGTVLLKPLHEGSNLVNNAGTLFLAARLGNDGTQGVELWKSNGTAAGTVAVKAGIEPAFLTPFNGKLYFSAIDAGSGREFWRSDGTAAGTVLVKDILEGQTDYGEVLSSAPYWFRVVGDALYFIANANSSPYSWGPVDPTIFRTDGTAGGTTEVGGAVSLSSRHSQASITGITVVNQDIYYGAYTRDFMEGYYSAVTKISPNLASWSKDFTFWESPVTNLTNVNGILCFVVGDGEDGNGQTLWRTDGTDAGTYPLPYLGEQYENLYITGLFGLGNWLYFTTTFGSGVPLLWRYDVSQPSTPPIRINAGGGAHTVNLTRPDGEGGLKSYPAYPYAADQSFTGGAVASYPDPGTLNGNEGPLYLNARWGQFSYNVPVPNGPYQVNLHFAEMYWGNGRAGGVGSRRFHVDAEGVRRLTNYDIFARAGGATKPIVEMITVQVTDGTLNLSFVKGAADNPAVSALEIIPLAALQGVPRLAAIPNQTVESGKLLTFTASALYSGTRSLTYSLIQSPPPGAAIHPTTGVFTWTPATPTNTSVYVQVSDNGNPAFSDVQYVPVCVTPRTDLAVLGSSQCNAANANGLTFQAVIVVKNAQPGVTYQARRSGTFYGGAQFGNGGDLTLSFPFTSTAPAPVTYTFDVVASASCREVTLTQKAQVALAPSLLTPAAAG